METVLRTDDLPAAERFPFWLDTIRRTMSPYEIRTDRTDDFQARLRTVQLGPVQAAGLAQQELKASRTAKHIRQSDPEHFQLGVNLRGWVEAEQYRRRVVLGPGDLVFHDTSHPFHATTRVADGLTVELLLAVPRPLLPLPPRRIPELFLTRLPGREGIGRLLSRQLLELSRGDCSYTPSDTARLGAVTVDLLAALLAHELDADAALPQDTRQRALFARVSTFLDEHLDDAALTPETIAAAHHMSLRSLHRLFRANATSVAAAIRTRRLERCRRALADPGLARHPVHAIAARWGFTSYAHFSRLFTKTHGLSPGEYRRRFQPPA
ncbi:AraC-like ligand-binding domain-containing protein [Streptomyces varsoviensis]|uniref:HTH araC/xylS-type domain-containing protein n=1 Tax=Streptomyces varsoviensis TaxID=67373 RepID=A0ABR5J5I0_9ACTN|nr:helix-turn-helix domain-containing protein [Streptomyces varsoviensis]KOG88726.1 hypothetical protein ADK38_18185 [Streptomyces varsoviensis]